ncbi:ABC transporter permease [Lederbergia graminis]|uniref:FtsX-like permease family protein n=1 Tax=Lederbergia graminis TaxID=735518 RepID=A0ABW0LHP7_9BACI
MAIFKLIFRKMLNNRWLTGSLFLGLIITVSLVSSIPTYTSSILQKMLISELEDYQIRTNQFPGEFTFTDTFANIKNGGETLQDIEKVKKDIIQEVGLPILTEVDTLATSPFKVSYVEERQSKPPQAGKLLTLTNLEDHINLIDGKYPEPEPVDGIFEVLVSEAALKKREIVLGTEFYLQEKDVQFHIKPVGVFQPVGDSPYWSMLEDNYSEDFILHEDLFRKVIMDENEKLLGISQFRTAFDYYEIKEDDIPRMLGLESRLRSEINQVKNDSVLFRFPIKDILRSYANKGEQLTIMLWSLNVPVLIMLAVYLYMISKLIIDRQLTEISVLASRGASRWQILGIYFIEILTLSILAFFIGPYLGLQLCKVLGASNGFLEFVQRSSLPIELTSKAYVYAFFALLASIVMIMIPVYRASGQSIVSHKQESARKFGKQNWYTITFELLLFGISIYGLMNFNRRQQDLLAINGNPSDLMIDPILFFIPALFIIGLGLIILRIYPFVLMLIYKLGAKFWPVSLYSTFLQVSRSARQYQFLMLFLIMTIGIGVFSASAARTINSNLEEQIYYEYGADVKVSVRWKSTAPPSMYAGGQPGQQGQQNNAISERVVYTEPSFEPFTQIPEVEQTAKVFQKEGVTVTMLSNNRTMSYASLMGIESKDFGEVNWFKDSLLQHHWYEYLNLLAKEPSAVIISREVARSLNAKEGDYIKLRWDGLDGADFVVYGIVDYWPTFNPLKKVPESNNNAALVVANLPYIQNMISLEPYDVWMKLKPDVTREQFYESITDKGLPIYSIDDMYPKLIDLKNSALLLGLNGTMTLGFLISLMISFIGFILYWILTIKSRTLQYGIYRAMGIPMPKLISILVSEQVLTSGIACMLGVTIGSITSLLYVPLFKLSFNVQEMMPPFAVISDASDEMKIYMFVIIMLVLGSSILIGFLRSIKIDQAIKLGED